MPRTLFDKIWDAHLVAQRADGRDLVYIDRHVLHELHAPHAFEQLEKQRRPVRRPDLTFSMQDHTVATRCASQILSNRVLGMAAKLPDWPAGSVAARVARISLAA